VGCGKAEAPVPVAEKAAAQAPVTQPVPQATPTAPEAVAGEPKIELSTTEYDMGAIPNDKPSTGNVTIFNRGTAPLRISQVNTSCGCTVASVEESKKTIPPGGEAPLTVVVNPARIQGFESTKMLTVFSNDPKQPHLVMKVKAKIEPEYLVEPTPLAFGKIPKGEVAKKQIVVRQLQDAPFRDAPFELNVARLLGAPPGLTANAALRPEAEWASPGKREYAVDVALDTNAVPPGPYQGMLDLETNVQRVRHQVVNVTAEVAAPYEVSPRPASFGLVQPGQKLAGTITVASDQPVRVSDVSMSGKELTASQAKGADDKTVLINVAVAPGASGGAKREQLSFTVKVGDAVYKEQVQVIVVVPHPTPPPTPGA
jgi:hypothetical protein